MYKSIKIITASILSSVVAMAVPAQGQPQQWVLVSTGENGDRIYIDVASQVRLFDSGVKKNTFRAVTTDEKGKSLRGTRYQADCFQGTLAMYGLEAVNAQGSVIRQIPLDSADKEPVVPTKGTVAAEMWRYACSQF